MKANALRSLLSTSLLIIMSVLLVFNNVKIVEGANLLSKGQYKNTAIGFTDTKGDSAVPSITITDSHINSKWQITGCGTIKHTWLKGAGGNYYLPEGDATVQPGTYFLQIDGSVVQTSGSTCGYGKVQITLSYN